MSVTSAVRAGRAAAEARMTDTCTIRRVVSMTTNPLTGVDVPTYGVVYQGRCRFKPSQARSAAQEVNAAGHSWVTTAPEVHIPVGAAVIRSGDIVECAAAADDPSLVGRDARVIAPFYGSQTTATRLPLEAVEA